jgi:hypothetical protein
MQKVARRIERKIALYYYLDSEKWRVETHRPCGKKWAWYSYRPTAASLKRVKKIVGYATTKCNISGIDGRGRFVAHSITV